MSGFRVEFRDDRGPLDVDAGWYEEDGSYTRFFKSGRRLDQMIRSEVAAVPTEMVRSIVASVNSEGHD